MLTIDFSEFTKESKLFEEKIKTKYNNFVRKHALRLYKKILKRTPYRTGVLLKGWEIDFDHAEEFLTVWIENKVPYASYVEFGTPTQDPQLMMTLSVEEVMRDIEREIERE